MLNEEIVIYTVNASLGIEPEETRKEVLCVDSTRYLMCSGEFVCSINGTKYACCTYHAFIVPVATSRMSPSKSLQVFARFYQSNQRTPSLFKVFFSLMIPSVFFAIFCNPFNYLMIESVATRSVKVEDNYRFQRMSAMTGSPQSFKTS